MGRPPKKPVVPYHDFMYRAVFAVRADGGAVLRKRKRLLQDPRNLDRSGLDPPRCSSENIERSGTPTGGERNVRQQEEKNDPEGEDRHNLSVEGHASGQQSTHLASAQVKEIDMATHHETRGLRKALALLIAAVIPFGSAPSALGDLETPNGNPTGAASAKREGKGSSTLDP